MATSDDGFDKDRKISLNDKEYDPITFNVLKVKAEDLANQITLIDLPAFRAITPEELSSGAWTKKTKRSLVPTVMNFTDRFNSVCLWCQREVLSHEKASKRADVIEHFIKIAKHLSELNNLHAAFAVVSALQSHPVHRLTKTWNLVSRHDRSTFDKIARLFDSERNWERLREHVDTMKLPCIPYLGMFLTDLNYIESAGRSRENSFLEVNPKEEKINSIIRVIAHFQDSSYEEILRIECIQKYLRSFQFHEELLKFVEDDMYRLSLTREPEPSNTSAYSTHMSAVDFIRRSSLSKKLGSMSRMRLNRSCDNKSSPQSHSLTPKLPHERVKQPRRPMGHRKTQSLGTHTMLGLENISFSIESGSHPSSASTIPSSHSSDDAVDSATMSRSVFYVSDSSNPHMSPQTSLVHDFGCLLNMTPPPLRKSSTPIDTFASPGKKPSFVSPFVKSEPDELQLIDDGNIFPDLQGEVRKLVVRTRGSKPAKMRCSRRCYLELRGCTLYQFERRTLPMGCREERDLYRRKTNKKMDIGEAAWRVIKSGSVLEPAFELHHPASGKINRFLCSSQIIASEWYAKLMVAMHHGSPKAPANLISFD